MLQSFLEKKGAFFKMRLLQVANGDKFDFHFICKSKVLNVGGKRESLLVKEKFLLPSFQVIFVTLCRHLCGACGCFNLTK